MRHWVGFLVIIIVALAACGPVVSLPDDAQVALDDYISRRAGPGDQWRIGAVEKASGGTNRVWCATIERQQPNTTGPRAGVEYYVIYWQDDGWLVAPWTDSGESVLAALGASCRWR
ncbi:MAG: hypothetical protein JXQ72_11660 [Anaerolineae bacterium]|nr:hypothetical protein [Anaerolineae bacterium]